MACWYPSPWWPRWETKAPKEEKPVKKAKRKSPSKKKVAVTT